MSSSRSPESTNARDEVPQKKVGNVEIDLVDFQSYPKLVFFLYSGFGTCLENTSQPQSCVLWHCAGHS